jgi:nitroreductase
MDEIRNTILNAFEFRHACKEFDPARKIPDEDFKVLMEAARLSPSSFGFEPWKFIVVQNPEIREKLLPLCWGAQKQLPTSSHFVIILARKLKGTRYDSEYIHNISKYVHMLPDESIEARKNRYRDFQTNDFKLLDDDRYAFEWACRQTYIVLGNVMTAAAMMGIDSCPIEGFHKDKVESLLESECGLDLSEFGVSCMVSLGYRVKEQHKKTRQSMDSIAEWL